MAGLGFVAAPSPPLASAALRRARSEPGQAQPPQQRGAPAATAAAAAGACAIFATARHAAARRRRGLRQQRCASARSPEPSQPERRQVLNACLLAATVSAGDAAGAADGVSLMRQGMSAFTEGRVGESIDLFDASAKAGYPPDALWQRGLSLYYADRFSDGAKQFRDDVAKNPNDTEESIWAMLCEAQLVGFEQARKQMLTVGYDRRNVMRSVYSLFRGDEEAKNLQTLQKTAESANLLDGGSGQFYASLYLGLFAEAKGDSAEARRWIDKAVATGYGATSFDYMAKLANVHQNLRNKTAPA